MLSAVRKVMYASSHNQPVRISEIRRAPIPIAITIRHDRCNPATFPVSTTVGCDSGDISLTPRRLYASRSSLIEPGGRIVRTIVAGTA